MVKREAPNHLRAWRLHRRLTQEALAEKIGTTKAVIGNLENGDRGLSDKWLRRLAPPLGTTPGHLLDHDPNDLATDILDIWAEVPEERRSLAREVLEQFARGTGTKG